MNVDTRARRAAQGIHGSVEVMTARAASSSFGTYESFVRFDGRRRRNQKIASIAVAMLLLLGLIGGAVRLFRTAERPTPATITPQNVGDLRVVGSADTGSMVATVAATDDAVYVSSAEGRVYAFSSSCATTPCEPLWTATLERWATRAVIAEGRVFVAEHGDRGDARLYAFREDCGSEGETCRPEWTADLDSPVAGERLSPIVAGNSVYVGTLGGMVYAFPFECGSSRCEPTWVRTVGQRVSSLAIDGGTIYVGTGIDEEPPPGEPLARSRGTISAFPADCGDCEPVWAVDAIGSVYDVEVAGGVAYVGMLGGSDDPRGGLAGYPTTCEGTCSAIWTARTECCADAEVLGDTVYVNQQSIGLAAFPTDCGGEECEPLWRSRVNAGFFQGLAFGNGVVFVGSGGISGIYAYPASCSDPCSPVWTELRGFPLTNAVVVGERLVVAGTSGMYVLGLRGGRATDVGSGTPFLFPIAAVMVVVVVMVVRLARRRKWLAEMSE